tara:strand:+ start:272 stop:610 length:339 start_codon:yes stop_codon:yes gene_type:complete
MVIENVPPELVGTGLDTLYLIIQPLFKRLSVLVGGIFGLYFILIVFRVYYEKKKVRLLKDIRYDLDRLNMSKGLSYSRTRKTIKKRLWEKILDLFSNGTDSIKPKSKKRSGK